MPKTTKSNKKIQKPLKSNNQETKNKVTPEIAKFRNLKIFENVSFAID
jgi:hypothetical protein